MISVFQYVVIFSVFLIAKEVRNCTPVDSKNPQTDAKGIVDSNFDHKIIAKILPFRTQEECDAINKAVASINGGKPLVDPKYIPLQNTNPYHDLIFALINDSMTVFSMYMGEYLDRRDETFIIMVFIQVDDKTTFKDVYDKQHIYTFDDIRSTNRAPFKNALKEFGQKLDDTPKCIINMCCVKGSEMQNERSSWNDKKRDELEFALMKESYKDSKCSIECYGTGMPDEPANLLDDIKNYMKNHDLADLYTSLVNYIQNQDQYLAQKLHDYSDGRDNWAIWIIILSTRRGDPMKSIDTAFQGLYQNITLKDYIMKCNIQDPIFKDMLTNLVDSTSLQDRQKPPPPPPPEPSYWYLQGPSADGKQYSPALADD